MIHRKFSVVCVAGAALGGCALDQGPVRSQEATVSTVNDVTQVQGGVGVESKSLGSKSIARVGPALHLKAPAPKGALPSGKRPTAMLIEEADRTIGAITVVVALEEPASPPVSIARSALATQRRGLVAGSQSQFASRVAALGGVVLRTYSLANLVTVRIDAKKAGLLASLPGVRELHTTGGAVVAETSADGNYVRSMDAVRSMYFQDNYISGGLGGHSGGPVHIAMIEPVGYPQPSHYMFKDAQTGSSRVVGMIGCSAASCSNLSSWGTDVGHAQKVASVLGGNIMYGQDPSIVDPAERSARSWMAGESVISLFNAGDPEAILQAIETITYSYTDVDIVNMSLGILNDNYPSNACGYGTVGSFDPAGISYAIAAATDAGVLFVKSAGNRGIDATNCSATFPAWLPEVVAVGAVNTGGPGYVLAYNGTSMWSDSPDGSGTGGINYWVASPSGGASLHSQSVVTVVAPGVLTYLGSTAPGTYTTGDTQGTSMAAPVVAGGAALLRNMFWQQGWLSDATPQTLTSLIAVLGDSWDSSTGTDRGSGFSKISGAGRLRLHYFGGAGPYGPSDMTGAWYFSKGTASVAQGAESCFPLSPSGGTQPLPSTIQEVKVAATWNEHGGGSSGAPAADIDLSLWNACPTGNYVARGSWQHLWSDAGYDLRERIRVGASYAASKCVWACVYGYGVPSSRTVSVVGYAHSDDLTVH